MSETASRPLRRRRDSDTNRPVRLFTAAVGLVCAVVALLAVGVSGLVGGLLATALVIAFFWSGIIPMIMDRQGEAGMVAGLGRLLLTYSLRFGLVLLTLWFAAELAVVDNRWTGLTLIVCTLAFTAAQVAVLLRTTSRPRT